MDNTEQNKAAVIRFNKEYIEQGHAECFSELVAPDLVNHSAPEGAPSGPESMIHFLHGMLRKGFPDIRVTILDQIAAGDMVATRKEFHGTHKGEFLGIPASGKHVVIKVIDMIRLRNGRYIEHWGSSNLAEVMAEISADAG
nr:ester cyclase [uncultured Dyadobacter sp.]